MRYMCLFDCFVLLFFLLPLPMKQERADLWHGMNYGRFKTITQELGLKQGQEHRLH